MQDRSSPFCPNGPGSPVKKQPALLWISIKYHFPNYLLICANMPLGPGSPLSPLSEYASVSKSRKKFGSVSFKCSRDCFTYRWFDVWVCEKITDQCIIFPYLLQHPSGVQPWPAAGQLSVGRHCPVLVHSLRLPLAQQPPDWSHCQSGSVWTQTKSCRCMMSPVGR